MRLNENNTFIGINPPYQLSVIHSSKLIYPREIYQRGVERKRVELIARDFNEYIVNEPKISFRNGRYYVMDGQHTIEGCILLNGGADRPILCKIYTGLTMEQEALLFAEQNGHAAPLSAGIRLRAKVVGGDAPSKAFVAATNRVGLSLNYDSMQLSDYRISCVGTALKLYDQLGEEIYCEALRHIVEAWEGRPDSFRAAVLRGVMYFVQLYHGQYSAERLVRALSGVHPMELYRISRDNPAKLPGWRRYVYPHLHHLQRQVQERRAADEVLNSNISFGKGDGTRKRPSFFTYSIFFQIIDILNWKGEDRNERDRSLHFDSGRARPQDGAVHDDVQGLPGCGIRRHSSGNAWHLPEECVSAGQAE